MYKRVKTTREITLRSGAKCHPIASLKDEYGGRCHICIDDHCYVLYLGQKSAGITSHIFKEAFNVLKTLPEPK